MYYSIIFEKNLIEQASKRTSIKKNDQQIHANTKKVSYVNKKVNLCVVRCCFFKNLVAFLLGRIRKYLCLAEQSRS